jgi:two-component system CheB/CheR fusion protein
MEATGTAAMHPDPARPGGLCLVGIGAEAGGLSALCTMLNQVPADAGFVCLAVVPPLPAHDADRITELLQPYTRLRVQQVTKTTALEPNGVYLVPRHACVTAIDTYLRLSPNPRPDPAPVDRLLCALARSDHALRVGVILTGSGCDGTLGIRQVRARGGLAIAQQPEEAELDGMPRSAIATGMVDRVLPLRDIVSEIRQFSSTRPCLPAPGAAEVHEGRPNAYAQVLDELRLRTGRQLALYEPSAILPRIERRMRMLHLDSLAAYLQHFRLNAPEAHALSGDVALSAPEFFDDPALYEHLEAHVLPGILERRSGGGERVRAWCIGCSTGEEACSLAMLLLKQRERLAAPPVVQVFGSDPSGAALAGARDGVYPETVANSVPPGLLRQFFDEGDGWWRVRPELRDAVVFAEHDLFRDPPFAHLDLVLCRDLLRALKPDTRRAVLALIHYALEPGGTLVVGPHDPVDEPGWFEPAADAPWLFRRKAGPTVSIELPGLVRSADRNDAGKEAQHSAASDPGTYARIHRRAAERYAPPSVLVGPDNRVVYYSWQAARHVSIPGGELTHDILDLVREPLRSRLAAGLEEVRKHGVPWQSETLRLPLDEEVVRLILHVEPVALPKSPEAEGLLLIVFDERVPQPRGVPGHPGAAVPSYIVAELERELAQSEARLRAALGANQDDVTASAGLRDELHAALAALDGAREELQSLNEEMLTLEEETRYRSEELAELSTNLQELLDSTDIATLFLDGSLRIVRYTRQLTELFHLRYGDRGRPLSDLTHELHYPDLETDARRVKELLAPIQREVTATDGRWYEVRMRPHVGGVDASEGVVITFIDITDSKRVEAMLREADRRKDEFLAVLAHELRNPLAPITSGIELLRVAGDNPAIVRQVADTMQRQTQQLVRLIDDLMETSRISGGRLKLRKAAVELTDVIADAIVSVRPLLDAHRHELTTKLPPEPLVLEADAARLTQVIANLLNNAARYTPDGGRIEVSAEREDDEVVIAVSDSGIGMPAGVAMHAFDMFYQGEDKRIGGRGGLGVGLTLAKSLVEMHGGTIAVESPGRLGGSDLLLRLPLKASAERAEERPRVPPDGAPPNGHRVLIVDDNNDAAETLGMMLGTLGDIEIQTASNGSQALAAAAEFRPDVVLLDLRMPGMDGYEVARRLRSEPWGKELLLVALTGWGQAEHRRLTREAGFDRHLVKPADLGALRSVLAEGRPRA